MRVTEELGGLLLAVFLLFASILGAVTIGWDASNSAGVTYAVYWGPASRTYTNAIQVGTNCTARITGLAAGSIQYFAVTASANGLQSDFSDEIAFTVPSTVLVQMQASTNVVGPWTNLFSLIVTNPQGQQYFRFAITNL